MKNGGVLISALGLCATMSCGGDLPVPDQPTWVDDVQPILRGNCFSCHGAGKRSTDAHRWDFFYNAADPRLAQVAVPADLIEVSAEAPKWPVWLTLPTGDFMPPPPAPRLSARDLEVMRRFAARPQRGTRADNHRPTIAWYPAAPWILVSDDDHEAVLGKLSCSGVPVLIDRTGTQPLPAGASPPCTGTLYDGQDLQTVELK